MKLLPKGNNYLINYIFMRLSVALVLVFGTYIAYKLYINSIYPSSEAKYYYDVAEAKKANSLVCNYRVCQSVIKDTITFRQYQFDNLLDSVEFYLQQKVFYTPKNLFFFKKELSEEVILHYISPFFGTCEKLTKNKDIVGKTIPDLFFSYDSLEDKIWANDIIKYTNGVRVYEDIPLPESLTSLTIPDSMKLYVNYLDNVRRYTMGYVMVKKTYQRNNNKQKEIEFFFTYPHIFNTLRCQ